MRRDPTFLNEDIILYDFDTLGHNLEVILELLGDPGAAHFGGKSICTITDIGCPHGDLGFAFAEAGCAVALLDKSHLAEQEGSSIRQNAPLVASIIARNKGSRAVIIDRDMLLERAGGD